jgi:hypothetical protein
VELNLLSRPRLLSRIPVAQRPAAVWIETALVVLLVPVLGIWLNPADPLFVRTGFPWAVLAPLVAGLRYGFGPGFGAAAALGFVTVAAWKGIVPLHFPAGELSAERTVGLLLCGMITGEFSGLWRRRIEAIESQHAHQRLRFESFVRSYQALRISHDLLESRVGGAAPTLREALRALGDLPAGKDARPDALAQPILQLFATFAQVRQGAIFLTAEPGGPLSARPAAHLGPAAQLDDPLIEEALRRHQVVAFDSALGATTTAGRSHAVVLAAPLEDVEGRLWGVLAVTDLPFSAYDAEAPARFAALAGHVADRLAFHAPERLGADDGAENVQAFERRLRRAAHDRRAHGLASGVVQLAIEGKRAAEIAETIARQRRVTDQVLTWRRRDGRTTVTLLLPMTDDVGVARYLGRVEAAVRQVTGASLAESGVRILQHTAIDDGDRMAALELDGETAVNDGNDDPKREVAGR